MNKYASFLAAVALTTGFVALRTTDATPVEPMEPISVQEALANNQKVTDMVASYKAFKTTLESTVNALRKKQMALKEAHAIVTEASTRYFPRYLEMLVISEKGTNAAGRLARNLVGHVRCIEEFQPSNPSAVPDLEKELQVLLAEIDP